MSGAGRIEKKKSAKRYVDEEDHEEDDTDMR